MTEASAQGRCLRNCIYQSRNADSNGIRKESPKPISNNSQIPSVGTESASRTFQQANSKAGPLEDPAAIAVGIASATTCMPAWMHEEFWPQRAPESHEADRPFQTTSSTAAL